MKYKLKKGEAYIDTVVTVFINLVILYLILNLFSYMITYQKLNHAADNIIRCAAIHGTTGDTISEDVYEYITSEGFERSKVEVSFDSTEYMSGSSKNIQFGDTIILNVKTKQSFKFIGKTGTSLFDISINKTALSEKYHQSNAISSGSGSVNETLKRNDIIPEGGTYTKVDGTALNPGDVFPEPEPNDTYEEGDYIYKYNYYYDSSSWIPNASQNGWGMVVKNTTKTEYGKIISEIVQKPLINMRSAFNGCTSLITAPVIPNSVTNIIQTFKNCTSLVIAPVISDSVTNMAYTFEGCTSLTTAPTIPNSVTNMRGTFGGCTSLTGNIEINANPSPYSGCFTATNKPITITGSCSDKTKAALAGTTTNDNITY